MTKTTKPTPKRRWFRFSLRTLLIVVLLLSLPLGWFALKMREAEKQRKAVEAIEKAGGTVWYDYQEDESGMLMAELEPPAPTWLRELVGEDFFSDVIVVSFVDAPEVGNAALEHFKVLTRLKWLLLYGTQVTDVGLENLSGLAELESLNIDAAHVTDEGLKYLTGLTNLHDLNISRTRITDEGLEYLKGMPSLEFLSLSETQLTNAGCLHLKWLINLRVLDLGGTQVTDEGLEHIKKLIELEYLDLCDTHVTKEGIEELEKALPNCEIHRTNPDRN